MAELEALAGAPKSGSPDRLMVMMPPGSAKSTYASVIFPAWWLLRQPKARIIAACHTEGLAAHFGRQVRALLASHGGSTGPADATAAWPPGASLARDERAANRFATAAGGGYFGVGVRGPLAGRRAELVIVDDPVKSWAEAESALARETLWNWFRADLTTRLAPRGRIVLVMTRWHEDDLAGRLLEGGDDWRTLCLPALAGAGDPLGRSSGEPLWPEWEDAAALARRRAALGPRAWAALYQQQPRCDAEALFQVGRIAVLEETPVCRRMVRAWDLAATAVGEARDPDWTVGLKLGRLEGGGAVVLDVLRLRAGPGEVARTIVQTAKLDGTGVVVGLPQDPGQAGKQQAAWLAGLLAGFRVVASPESGAKLTRAGPAAAAAETGQLAVLRAAWTRAFLDELREFPSGRKDDQVDALSRAFALLAEAPARRLMLPFIGR
jgi:predicted phage terminase large subunit-like protein